MSAKNFETIIHGKQMNNVTRRKRSGLLTLSLVSNLLVEFLLYIT